MHDDDAIDRLLKKTMTVEVPALSPAFEAKVLRRVRPHRLSPTGRTVIVVYGVAAVVATAWLLRGLDPVVILVGTIAGLSAGAAVSAYVQRLVGGR
jgi:hypothetical protein